MAWQDADEPLLTFVQQAQAGLARIKGAIESKNDAAIDHPGEHESTGIR